MIRPYEHSDFYSIVALNDISYERPCSGQELLDKISSGKCWVAEEGGAVVGCVICCPQDGKDFIWSITVSPKYQRRGIGWNLLSEVENTFPELYLHTEPYRRGFGLYARRGYLIFREEPNFYGPSKPAIMMVKFSGHNSAAQAR